MKTHSRLCWALMAALLPLVSQAQPSLQPLVTEQLAEPYGVAADEDNNYYITDSVNNRIAKYIGTTGVLTNFSGKLGVAGSIDGPAGTARFFNPQGIALSEARAGLVVADSGNHMIRLVSLSNGEVSTIAGSTELGLVNETGAAARFNAPAGVAVDNAGNIFVADTLNNVIRRIDPANAVTTVATGFFRPTAVAVDQANNRLFVADTGTHSIRVVDLADGSVSLAAGSGNRFIIGDTDSADGAEARFNSPRGLAWVGGKTGLMVSDTGNGILRRLFDDADNAGAFSVERFAVSNEAALGMPVGLAGDRNGDFPLVDLESDTLFLVQVTAPQEPVSDPSIGFVYFTTNSFGQIVTALQPVVSATFNNDVNVAILAEDGTETFYTLDPDAEFPEDAGSRSTPDEYENGLATWDRTIVDPAMDGSNVMVRAISTGDGRRPSSIVTARFRFKVANPVINGKNPGSFTVESATTDAEIWYTTDGTDPTNALPSRRYAPGSALNIVDGSNDVTFKARAFKNGYEASAIITKVFLFEDLLTSTIGFTRDFEGGIGSTIIIPLDIKVAPDTALASLQFRVEVEPNNGALPVSTLFRNIPITTNDFIQLPVPAARAPLVIEYEEGATRGLGISFIAHTDVVDKDLDLPPLLPSDLNLSGQMSVTLLAVPIPQLAEEGDTYTVRVVQPSGTTDGIQNPVFMDTFSARTITVTNRLYTVGDSAVGNWYNAGEFGNGNLNNNDVNNAFLASCGIRPPHAFSDLFDAMDVFPEDSLASVGGDGQIRYLDWHLILQRSLRMPGFEANWARSWSAGGFRQQFSTNLNGATSLPATEFVENSDGTAGLAWETDVQIRAGVVENASAGAEVYVPVYAVVDPERELKGLQLRVAVVPSGDAPHVSGQVAFEATATLPAPVTLSGASNGLGPNETVSYWSLLQNPFPTAVRNEKLIGRVRFNVPAGAQAGDSYVVRFPNVDGAPNLQTQYEFESIPGRVWVDSVAQQRQDPLPDEWKARFFGSVESLQAVADGDADGDGISNLEEYLQGRNPVSFRVHDLAPEWRESMRNGEFRLQFFGQAGQDYVVEVSEDLNNWLPIRELAGNGELAEWVAEVKTGGLVFYRVREKSN